MHLNIGNRIFECFCLNFFKLCTDDFFESKFSHCNSVRSAIMISEDHAIQVLYLKTNVLLLEWQMLWMLVTDQRSYINRPRCQFQNCMVSIKLFSCTSSSLTSQRFTKRTYRGQVLIFSVCLSVFSNQTVSSCFRCLFSCIGTSWFCFFYLQLYEAPSVRSKDDIWFNCLVMLILAHILGDI